MQICQGMQKGNNLEGNIYQQNKAKQRGNHDNLTLIQIWYLCL